MGMPHKTQLLACFHTGDLITSIHKVSMVATAGASRCCILHGTVGVLVPLALKEDINFITTLEQHIRTE
jgi:splicing factor 3B subunit 3